MLDYGRFSQSMKLQYEEEAGPKKHRERRNMKLRDIIFFVIFAHCVKFQSHIMKSFMAL